MDAIQKNMMVFAGTSNLPMAQKIAEHLGVELGDVKVEKFANGEIYARYMQSVRGADVFIVQSVSGQVNDALMELLIMTDAAKRASARTVTAVITHYGYARQDKKSASREPITAKLVANLYEVAGVDRVIAMDLHQGQIQGFFDIPVNHLTALPVFADHFAAKKMDNLCVVSPDGGRAKAAKKLSDLLDCDLAIMAKNRPEHNKAEVSTVIGNVEGKNCVVNDDMIDTAGTICASMAALKEAGAKSIHVCATHGLFSGPAVERIAASVCDEVVVTDTVPLSEAAQNCPKIKVISVSDLFARAIHNVYTETSVSEFFDPDFQL